MSHKTFKNSTKLLIPPYTGITLKVNFQAITFYLNFVHGVCLLLRITGSDLANVHHM